MMFIWSKQSKLSSCLFLICFFSFLPNNKAQYEKNSPYQLKWQRETALLSGGVASTSAGIIFSVNMEALSIDAIANADPDQIWAFDRGATRYWSTNFANASNWTLGLSCSFPVLLLFDKQLCQDFWATAFIGTEAIFITTGLTGLTKVTTRRKRPYIYNPEAPFEEKTKGVARLSFFSRHTASAAVLCFVSAKMYMDHHPDSPMKAVIWTTAATIPAVTGYFRYRAGRHFPTDVIMGYLIGAGIGILVPELHKKRDIDTGFFLEPRGGLAGSGVALGWRF